MSNNINNFFFSNVDLKSQNEDVFDQIMLKSHPLIQELSGQEASLWGGTLPTQLYRGSSEAMQVDIINATHIWTPPTLVARFLEEMQGNVNHVYTQTLPTQLDRVNEEPMPMQINRTIEQQPLI